MGAWTWSSAACVVSADGSFAEVPDLRHPDPPAGGFVEAPLDGLRGLGPLTGARVAARPPEHGSDASIRSPTPAASATRRMWSVARMASGTPT